MATWGTPTSAMQTGPGDVIRALLGLRILGFCEYSHSAAQKGQARLLSQLCRTIIPTAIQTLPNTEALLCWVPNCLAKRARRDGERCRSHGGGRLRCYVGDLLFWKLSVLRCWISGIAAGLHREHQEGGDGKVANKARR